MNESDEDQLLYLGLGPMAAILLGGALMPLRGVTVASNFTFAFLALTVVVGELGGRLPALATALVSALSLDFFLTRPYLHLAMHDKNDLVAFIGLAACGLLAAFLGSPRRERDAARERLRLVDRALRQIEAGGPAAARAQLIADLAVNALPLAAVVVRDDHAGLVAASGAKGASEREPGTVVSASTVAAADHWEWRTRNPPLPRDGLRVALIVGSRPVGALDVWGNGQPAGREARRAVGALATILAALLDTARHSPAEASRPPSSWTVGRRRAEP
jgi:K+-sensing histidine kinase KdpD